MAEIIGLKPGPVGDGVALQPDAVLSAAVGRLGSVVIVGLDDAGELYLACSHGRPDSFVLLHRAAKRLLSGLDA